MKAGGRKHRRALRAGGLWGEAQDGFVKGFIATGLLAALRDGQSRQQVLRQALQGGTALAAASATAAALEQGAPLAALTALAAGAAGLVLAGRVPGPRPRGRGITAHTS